MAQAKRKYITPHRLSDANERRVVTQYTRGKTAVQVAEDFGVGIKCINNILNRCNHPRHSLAVARQKLSLNHAAFSKVTPNSAYWTGFLMADGCIRDRARASGAVSVKLQISDISQLLKLKAFLKSGHKVSEYNNAAALHISSNQIVADLARFGVVPRKSTKEQVKGGLEFNHHFWRGVIDGDGSVRFYKASHRNGKPNENGSRLPLVALYGSEMLCNQFLAFVKTIYKGKIVGRVEPRPNNSIYTIRFNGNTARAIVKALYNSAPTYLDRKMETAQEIMQCPPFSNKRAA